VTHARVALESLPRSLPFLLSHGLVGLTMEALEGLRDRSVVTEESLVLRWAFAVIVTEG
jgi:hypothetical protein